MNQLKKIGLIIIGLFLALNLIGQQNVSKTGFYEGDSVFFEIKDTISKNGSIEFIVNTFSGTYKPYEGGFWLYNRNYEANTWENQNFTKYEDYPYDDYIDSLTFITKPLERGKLKKVNIIKARFLDESGKVQNEKVYFIGVNGKDIEIMHDLPVIHIYVDSIDAFGPEGFYGPGKGEFLNPWFDTSPDLPFLLYGEKDFLWNYSLKWSDPRIKKNVNRTRVEKESFIQIIDKNNNLILENQKVGIRLTGNTAIKYFNKPLQVFARNKYGSSAINTNLFSDNNESFKRLRLRVGGSSQDSYFGYNELALNMMDGLKIGEVKSKLAVLYLNGSYWSLVYIQEKLDEHLIGKTYNINPKNIDFLDIVRGWGTFSLFSMGDSLGYINSINHTYIPIDSSSKVRLENLDVVIPLEYDSFFKYHTAHYHDHLYLGIKKNGDSKNFQDLAKHVLQVKNEPPLKITYNEIDSLIDLKQWLKYICFLDFVGDKDHLDNNTMLANINGKTIIVAKDFDTSFSIDVDENFWQFLYFEDFLDYNLAYLIIKDVIFEDNNSIKWLIRIYQDLLNTNLSYSQTSLALKKTYPTDFFEEYENYHNSWGGVPNGGLYNASEYVDIKNKLDNYLNNRPNYAWQILADQWMPEENFNLKSRNKIKIVLDQVPRDCIVVKLNTLEIDSSWEGEYYPKPSLLISVGDKNNCINLSDYSWKEYPDSSLTMELFLTKTTTLTLVKR